MTEFTPWASLLGGGLIGISALILMAGIGRIAGISGIVMRLLPPFEGVGNLRLGLTFVAGLLLAVPAYQFFTGQAPQQTVSDNIPLLIIGGLLVGFGSAAGNGCTSGHGVCGISRGSGRSIIATITFVITAFVTVTLMRHVLGL